MASNSGNNTIILKGRERAILGEGTLSGAAYPGMNLVLRETASVYGRDCYSAGYGDYVGTGTSISLSAGSLKIVVEDSLRGYTVNDAYADGDSVYFHPPVPGDHLQVLVLSGQTVTKACGLSAGSDGKFVVDATNPTVEALEQTATLGSDTLVRVRVL